MPAFGAWDLVLGICLEFGIWCLVLKGGDMSSAALCLLGDAMLVEQRLMTLLEQWLTAASRQVDHHTFWCGETSLAEVLESVRLVPMAGAQRVVVLRGVERLAEEDAQRLAAYLQAP